MKNIKFSLRGRNSEVLRAFIQEHLLTDEEVDSGTVIKNNYPYTIVFDDIHDGITIMENLPCRVLVSFQTLIGGLAVAVVRIIRSQKR